MRLIVGLALMLTATLSVLAWWWSRSAAEYFRRDSYVAMAPEFRQLFRGANEEQRAAAVRDAKSMDPEAPNEFQQLDKWVSTPLTKSAGQILDHSATAWAINAAVCGVLSVASLMRGRRIRGESVMRT